jgi:hypothetical protein
MDIFTAAGAALRRWYVTVPIIALSAYVAVQQYQAVEPFAQASASILVLPGAVPGTDEETLRARQNPLLSGGTGLVRQVLVQTLNSGQTQQRFRQDGAQVPFVASTSRDSPFVKITATAVGAAAAEQTVDVVVQGSDDLLRDLQLDLGATDFGLYRVVQVFPSGGASVVQPERNRTVIAVLVGGTALAIVLAVLLDNLLSVRSARRGSRRGQRGDAGPGVEDLGLDLDSGTHSQEFSKASLQSSESRRRLKAESASDARTDSQPSVLRQPLGVDRDSA